ncbi:MAG: DUF4912 domain-containing protein [Methylococcaceae bacterium]|nr:DUF4912 domain-containing protein [Methylococcaceae bacterium]
MLAISQAISREFAPRFTGRDAAVLKPMAFSVRELLAISQEISREFSPRPVEHRSSLVLLPIDPRRLHAYWHLNESSFSTGLNTDAKPVADEQQSAAAEQLTLRVFKQFPQAIETINLAEPPSWIDIPVDSGQCRQEVILPAESAFAGGTYRAEIGVSHGKHDFTALAVSNAAVLPSPQLQRGGGLSDIIAQFSVPISPASSPIGKAASHPEIRGSQ